jgi:SAM-dependent MidA family methyltransferase
MLTHKEKTHNRAVRYRRLALAETNPQHAKLLQQIADEADRGVLATADWMAPAKYMGETPKTA